MKLALNGLALCALVLCGCFEGQFFSEGPPSGNNFVSTGGGSGSGGGDTQALDSCGRTISDAPVIGQPAVPAISGGTMAVLSNGTVVAADPDRDLLHAFDGQLVARRFVLPQGSEPGRVIEGPRESVFVALRGGSQVAAVDLSTGGVRLQRACAAPRGLAYDPERQLLWVACASGELARIDTRESPWRTTVSHPLDDLRDVMLDGKRLLVTTFRDSKVWAIDTETMRASFWSAPLIRQSEAHQSAPQVAWRSVRSNGAVMMVHQREQLDAVAAAPMCFSSYGSPSSNGFGGSGGEPSSTMETVVTRLSAATPGDPGATEQLTLLDAVLPVDLAVSADGSHDAIAAAGSGLVKLFINGAEQNVSLGAQPISVAFDGQNQLWIFSREPAGIALVDADGFLVRQQSLGEPSAQSTGHDLFHLDTGNGIACASCHPEAGEDGHVWILPEGIRRTPSLRGGLSGTEPFHWSGEEADMDMLMTDVFVGRMNGAPQSEKRLGALLSWLDAQPSRPAPTDLDPQAATRGQALFAASGCGACHTGALGTNNSTVDVGTGEALQVPRLVELGYRAPFMHDGRAATLADRFDPSIGGTMHGDVSRLQAGEVADLIAYLKSR